MSGHAPQRDREGPGATARPRPDAKQPLDMPVPADPTVLHPMSEQPRTRPIPARSERLTVSRERPHSTGVEPTIHTSSLHTEVSVASSRVTRRSSPALLRSRLL